MKSPPLSVATTRRARCLVAVLGYPDQLVEIEAIAFVAPR
jgi:hypothetical protein